MGGLLVAFLILVILVLAVVVSCIKIVPQAHAYIVERLGGYLASMAGRSSPADTVY